MRFVACRSAIHPGTLCYSRGMMASGWRLNGVCMGLVLGPAPAHDRGGRRHASKKLTRGACTASRTRVSQSALVDGASLSCFLAPFSLVLLPRLRPALLSPPRLAPCAFPWWRPRGPPGLQCAPAPLSHPRWISPACACFCLVSPLFCYSFLLPFFCPA